MSKLPVILGRKYIKVLEKKGFCFKRQMESHMALRYIVWAAAEG